MLSPPPAAQIIFTIDIDSSNRTNLTNTTDVIEGNPSWRPDFAPTDTTAPRVDAVSPTNAATGVARSTSLTATFSEKMGPASITNATFQLYKVNPNGSITRITDVVVSCNNPCQKATLNPYGNASTLLAKNTKYAAYVTTDVEDPSGNALDQDPTKAGNQPKIWYFTTGK